MVNTIPPRNVIYCNDVNFLQQIPGLSYTDAILNFLIPDGMGGLTGVDTPDPGQVQAVHNAGKNVLVSLGGSGDVFPSVAWQQYAQAPNGVSDLVNQLVAFVNDNGLDGVDIDYEDSDGGFGESQTYDGVTFLIALTDGLARALQPGHIITHAPQPPYFDGPEAPYTQIHGIAGDRITWFNCQFYNNPGYDEPANKLTWYDNIAQTIAAAGGREGAPRLLVGAPVVQSAANDDGAWLSPGDFVSEVITPLQEEWGETFGGVMGWNFELDSEQGFAWANGIGPALAPPA
jgi:chitinase